MRSPCLRWASLLVVPVGLAACSDPGPVDTKDDAEICRSLVATATLAEAIPTVMTVRWSTAVAGTSVVEWGYDTSYGYTVSGPLGGEGVTDHAVVVAGMAPDTIVHWRVRSELPAGACLSPDHTLDIPAVADPLTTVHLDRSSPGFTPGFRLVPVAGTQPGVIAVDDAGREVWWHAPREGLKPVQAWLDHDGRHVLYLVESDSLLSDDGGIMRVSLDRADVTLIPLPACHHAFLQLPDGRFLYLATDARLVDGAVEEIAGDALMLVEADGRDPRVVYSTWDHYTPDVDALNADGGNYYFNLLDWTHANSINLRPDGTLLLSFHNLDTVVNLTMDGEVLWQLTGANTAVVGDFEYAGPPSDRFHHQHNPIDVGSPDDPAANGHLLLFDNGENDPGDYSEATEYALDEAAGTFTPVWNFEFDQTQSVPEEGDVQRLPNGNTLIDWGANGIINEVTPEGEIVWEVSNGGKIFGFMQQYDALGGALP